MRDAESWLTALCVNQTSEFRSCLWDRILVGSTLGSPSTQPSRGSSITQFPQMLVSVAVAPALSALGNPGAVGALNPMPGHGSMQRVSSLMSLQLPFSFACWDLKSGVARRELTAAISAGSSLPVSPLLQDPSKPPVLMSGACVPGVSVPPISPLPREAGSCWRALVAAGRGE